MKKTNLKHTSKLVALTSSALLVTGSVALAELPNPSWFEKEEKPKTDNKLESTFAACKDVEIIVDEAQSQKICASCNQQFAPDVTAMGGSLDKIKSHIEMKNFLSQVGEQVIENLNKQVQHTKDMQSCLKDRSAKDCSEKLTELDSRLQAFWLKDIAISKRSQPVADAKGKLTDHYNLRQSEIKEMRAEAEHYRKEMAPQMANVKRGDPLIKEVAFAIEDGGAKKRAREALELASKTPVSFFIKEQARYEKGKFQYTDQMLQDAYVRMKEAATKQIAEIRQAIKNGNIEHDGAGRLERLKTFAGKYDLLDMAAFGPAVEEVLKKNKGYCALATSAAKRYGIRDIQNDIYGAGAMLIGGFVGGAAIGAGVGLTGVGMAGLYYAGIALGSGFALDSKLELDRTKTAAKFGEKTWDQVEEREKEFMMSIGMHPLDFIGAGVVGKNVARSLSRSTAKAATHMTDPAAREGMNTLSREAIARAKTLEKGAKVNEGELVEAAAKARGASDDQAKLAAACLVGGKAEACEQAKVLLTKLGLDEKEIDYLAWAKRAVSKKQAQKINQTYKDQVADLKSALTKEDPAFRALVESKDAATREQADKFLVALIDDMETGQRLKPAQVKAKIHKALNECGGK